jgi:Flp pilus assembly protein TadD
MTEQIEKLMAQGNWVAAQQMTQQLLMDTPSSTKLHSYNGLCFFRMSRFEEAAREFKIAITLDDKNFDAALKLAQSLDRLLRFPEALEAANHAHKLRPGDATTTVLINGLKRQVQETISDAWQRTAHLQHNVSLSSE